MSGPFAMTVAAKYSRMKAAAALYGVDMVTDKPDSPHKLAKDIEGELYVGFAGHDPAVPATTPPALEAALKAAGTNSRWRRTPTRITASASPTGPTTTRWPRSDCWTTLFDLWDRNLK